MTAVPSTSDRNGARVIWSALGHALNRPYRVTLPMVVFVSLIPLYLVLGLRARGQAAYAPEMALDRYFPLVPAWTLVYGALYLFLIVVPVIVVQQDELIRRTVWAYLTVWLVSYAFFLLYPTVAPRPASLAGDGFAVWGLRVLYGADPPHNCFPSLHVAHSFVSALACSRVHRGLGLFSVSCASLVALSTLFIKQHYVADVIAGILLALAACAIFLGRYPRGSVPEPDRHLAPALALCTGGLVGLGLAVFWVVYRLHGSM